MEQLQDLTKIDWWFLNKLEGLIKFENEDCSRAELTQSLLFETKRKGFTDRAIAEIRHAWQAARPYTKEADIRTLPSSSKILSQFTKW